MVATLFVFALAGLVVAWSLYMRAPPEFPANALRRRDGRGWSITFLDYAHPAAWLWYVRFRVYWLTR